MAKVATVQGQITESTEESHSHKSPATAHNREPKNSNAQVAR